MGLPVNEVSRETILKSTVYFFDTVHFKVHALN